MWRQKKAMKYETYSGIIKPLVFRALLFSLLVIMMLCGTSGLAEETTERQIPLRVNPFGGDHVDMETVTPCAIDGNWYLFLPVGAKPEDATIWLSADLALIINGKEYHSGDTCPELMTPGEHIAFFSDDEDRKYTLYVYRSENIPAVFISTESGSLEYIHASKNNKEAAFLFVYENGEITADRLECTIKGRGNATWNEIKKPYNVPLEENTNLLGMPEAKKWSFLANYLDPSLLRNATGWELAKNCGLDFTSEYRHVDLYINGEYQGNYTICESVEVGPNRVDICDLEKENRNLNETPETYIQQGTGEDKTVQSGSEKGSAKWVEIPQNPEDISGGYLLELDYDNRYDEELCGFVTDNGQCVVIQSPKHASQAEVEYIRKLFNEAYEALYSETGYNSAGKHYSEYFDMDSFVAMYIVQEISNNIDAGVSSQYIYKQQGNDKLYFSPVWDMDHAFGDHIEIFNTDIGDPTIWWANSVPYAWGVNKIPNIFSIAYKHDDFRDAVRTKWDQIKQRQIPEQTAETIDQLSVTIKASAIMDAVRWNINPEEAENRYLTAYEQGRTFLQERIENLNKGFSEDAIILSYDANGGRGFIYDPRILCKGDTTKALENNPEQYHLDPPEEGMIFAGWNTKPDGSGKELQPGDEIPLDGDFTLYAIWVDTGTE